MPGRFHTVARCSKGVCGAWLLPPPSLDVLPTISREKRSHDHRSRGEDGNAVRQVDHSPVRNLQRRGFPAHGDQRGWVWCLIEIKGGGDAGGPGIPRRQRDDTPVIFDEAKDRREVVRRRVDIAMFGIGTDELCGSAKPISIFVDLWRRDVVIPPAPIVVRPLNDGGASQRTDHDRTDHAIQHAFA